MQDTQATKYIPFLEKRMYTLIIFIIIFIIGIFAYFTKGFKLGTDFSGGIRIEFTAPASTQDIRDTISNNNISIISVRNSTGVESFLLTAPANLAKNNSGDYLLDTLRDKYGKEKILILTSDFVGPSIGADFTIQSLKLLGLVIFLILIYVAFRFDFLYGLGAVIALIHDMFLMAVCTLVLQIPIDLTVLAAFLTILGYSINDTIVIFDRVRENHLALPEEDFLFIIDKSITQSLRRTILTSITTLFVASSIFIWAGNSLKSFSLLLIIGIISGTYSSIFVASPITYLVWKMQNKNK